MVSLLTCDPLVQSLQASSALSQEFRMLIYRKRHCLAGSTMILSGNLILSGNQGAGLHKRLK